MAKQVALTETQDTNLPAVTDPEMMQQIIEDNLGDMTPEFPRVGIPAGGGIAFEVPNETGEAEAVSEIVGVIVDHYAVNAYWADAFSGQGQPPDCSSSDGKTGTATAEAAVEWAGQTRDCRTCPLNQFGSDPRGTGGKACKNMRRVFIVRAGEILPIMVVLPPTSIRNFTTYMARLTSRMRPYTSVVTRIKLQKVQSKGGISYSQAVFTVADQLDQETADTMRSMSKGLRPATRGVGVDMDDYSGGGAPDDNVPF